MEVSINGARILATFENVPIFGTVQITQTLAVAWLVMILVIIARTLIFGDPTSGWPSLVCIMLLLSGIQMLGIGIVGQYLAKTYLETKKRPIYLVRQTNIGKL